MQRTNLLRLIVLLVVFAAAACAQRSRYSIEQRPSTPGVLCWKDSAGAELCFTIQTGALPAGSQTWKFPGQDIGGGGCWKTDGSYNVTVGACGAGGGGSSNGSISRVQLSDGSGGFSSVAGFEYTAGILSLPAQSDGAHEGGQLALAGTSRYPVVYNLDQYVGGVRLYTVAGGTQEFGVRNYGGTLNMVLGGSLWPDGTRDIGTSLARWNKYYGWSADLTGQIDLRVTGGSSGGVLASDRGQ